MDLPHEKIKLQRAQMYSPLINPFLANGPILYPLKTPEDQIFSGVFRGGIKWEHLSEMG